MTADLPSQPTSDPGAPQPQHRARDQVAAFLDGLVKAGASSQEIGSAVAAAFRGIDRVLMPVVGQRGVAALYKRTVHLSGQASPGSAVALKGMFVEVDMAQLASTLGQQTAADAAATGHVLLQTFHKLLSSLIGLSLTERLLRPVWANFMSGPSAGDTAP